MRAMQRPSSIHRDRSAWRQRMVEAPVRCNLSGRDVETGAARCPLGHDTQEHTAVATGGTLQWQRLAGPLEESASAASQSRLCATHRLVPRPTMSTTTTPNRPSDAAPSGGGQPARARRRQRNRDGRATHEPDSDKHHRHDRENRSRPWSRSPHHLFSSLPFQQPPPDSRQR